MKKRSYRRGIAAAAAVCSVAGILAGGVLTPAVCRADQQDQSLETQEPVAVNLSSTYHARLGIQTADDLWITQMSYYDDAQNETYGTDLEHSLYCADSKGKKGDKLVAQPGEIDEVELAGNGTYTVSLTGAEFSGETTISQLHVATDIPVNDSIKFTDVTARINDVTVAHFDEGFMEYEENYLTGGEVLLIFNHWRDDLKNELTQAGRAEDADNGYRLLKGQGQEKVEVTFTVTGFDYDNEAALGSDAGGSQDGSVVDQGNIKASSTDHGKPVIVFVVVIIVVVILAAAVIIGVAVHRKRQS